MAGNKDNKNTRISDFLEKQKAAAKDFEKKQSKNGSLDPQLSDIREGFEKNRNEVVIGERIYIIKKFGIRDTLSLIPVLGNSFIVPASACLKGEDAEEGGVGNITEGLLMLFDNLQGDKFTQVIDLLLSQTTLDGKIVDMDEDFEDIGDVFKVCVKSLEISFGPFLKSLDLSRMTGWLQNIQQLR